VQPTHEDISSSQKARRHNYLRQKCLGRSPSHHRHPGLLVERKEDVVVHRVETQRDRGGKKEVSNGKRSGAMRKAMIAETETVG
jgi:hypothetical protein